MMNAENIGRSRGSRGGWLLEAFLLTSMTLVAMALGVGLYLQFGLTLWLAGVAALSMYVALVSAHVLIRRSETISVLHQELGRLEDEVEKLKRIPAPPAGPQPRLELGPPRPGFKAWRPPSGSSPASRPMDPGQLSPGPIGPGPLSSRPPSPRPPSRASFVMPDAAQSNAPPPTPRTALPAPAARPGMGPSLPMAPAAGPPMSSPFVRGPETAAALREDVSALSSDVDAINGMIRRLAEEMGAPTDMSAAAAGPLPPAPRGPDAGEAMATPEASLSASVDALRTAAQKMRKGDATEPLPSLSAPRPAPGLPLAPKAPAGGAGNPTPPPVGPAQARLAEIADAIAAERLDVHLEPILGLNDRRAHHYEFSVCLRTRHNEALGPREYAAIARGSGMLPLLDAACVPRIARVAAYMVERGSPGALFASTSGESLASEHLLKALSETYRRGSKATERVIMSFAQADVRAPAPAQWGVLKRISDFGLRLALEDVTSFDIDFKAFKSAGFAFLKADARHLFGYYAATKSDADAKDLLQRLTQSGLSLIVTGVESDQQIVP